MAASVQSFFHAPTGTFSHLACDPATQRAAVIDPVLDYDAASGRIRNDSAQRLLDAVRERSLRIEWILETHAHADHLTAAQWLKREWPQARIAIGEGIRNVQRHFAPVFGWDAGFAQDGSQFDHLFADGEAFALGTLSARVIATPGHTDDGVAYLIGDALFTGDTVFQPDCGTARCDFPGGDAGRLFDSIQRLFALPDDTRVFICHDYPSGGAREPRAETSIGEQKRSNIHLRDGATRASFEAVRRGRDATLAMPHLLLPSVQVNIRAGHLPEADAQGRRFLKIPLQHD